MRAAILAGAACKGALEVADFVTRTRHELVPVDLLTKALTASH